MDGGVPLREDCCERARDEAAHALLAGRTREGAYQLRYGGNKLGCDEALACVELNYSTTLRFEVL